LSSILSQDPVEGDFEVIVADGLSDDGTRATLTEWVNRDARVRVVDNPGKIVSTGLNEAIRAARGEVIVRVDAHTEYAPDYLRQCVAVLEETGADNVGGPWVPRAESWVGRAIATAFQSPFSCGGGRAHEACYEGELDTVYLGCWRKDTLLRLGLFDEELVRNQDDELNLRLIRGGGRVWQSPRIRSSYRPRTSFAGLFRQYQQYGYWKVRVIQKHGTPASVRHLIPVLFVFGVVLGLPTLWIGGPLAIAYLAGLCAYAIVSLIFSASTARATDWTLFPILPLIFLLFHAGYGVGFARGIWDFVITRKGARQGMTVLTRKTAVSHGDSTNHLIGANTGESSGE
jgi:glycosyltransferase involved in cell wall biosynthesis